jgi:uncharacterized protein involved in exopolysaccharide biosynthesis
MTETDLKSSVGEEEVHLLDYLIVLAKHSRMILFTSAAVSAFTLVVLFFTSNKYTATARLLPPQQNLTLSGQILDSLSVSSSPGAGGGGLGGMAASLFGLKSPGEVFVSILKGETIADRIIARFDLKEVFEAKYIEDARRRLAGMAAIKSGKDGLIVIEVTDKIPQRAADLANAYAEELDRLQQEMAVSDARNQLAFLEKERVQCSLNLTRAEEALRIFSEKSSVIQIDAQAKGMIEYIAQLRAAIDAKEIQLQVLRQQLTGSNYDLIRLETELKGLREKLKTAEIQTDQACIGDVCIATGKMPTLGLEYFRLYREVKYQEAMYQLFVKMAEIARLDAARNAMVNTIQFVDRAKPPERKSQPKRLLTTLLVGVVSFFILVLVAFAREYWQNAARSADMALRLRELDQHIKPWRETIWRFLKFLRLKRD